MTKFEEFKQDAVKLREKYADEKLQTMILAVDENTSNGFYDSAITPSNAVKIMASEVYELTDGDVSFQVEFLKKMQNYLDSLNEVRNSPRTIAVVTSRETFKFKESD